MQNLNHFHYQYFSKDETMPNRSPKIRVQFTPAPLFSGSSKLFVIY